MTRFAIRGLLSRKLRTALTALAIVLGVAMISGTYVLTDSIDQAFDRIFTDIRKGSNAVISGKSAFDLSDGSGVTEPTFDESLLDDVRALSGVAEAEGSVDSDTTQLIGDDGKAVVFGGAPNLGFSIANPDSRFNPLTLVEGEWPEPDQVVIDKETAGKEDFEVGGRHRDPGRGPGPAPRDLRDHAVQLGPVDRRGDARRLRPPDRSAPDAKGGPPGRDRGRLETRRHRPGARTRDPGDPPGRDEGAGRRRAGAGGRRRHERVHHVPADVPARIRRHRALRGLLRHRQFTVDNDRPAHA